MESRSLSTTPNSVAFLIKCLGDSGPQELRTATLGPRGQERPNEATRAQESQASPVLPAQWSNVILSLVGTHLILPQQWGSVSHLLVTLGKSFLLPGSQFTLLSKGRAGFNELSGTFPDPLLGVLKTSDTEV